jgi:hypothetical protein
MRRVLALLALACVPAFSQDHPRFNFLRAAVAIQCAANATDIASSWRQPEGTAWLATNGRFASKALGVKIGLSAGISAASFLIGRKWRTSRPYVSAFNLGVASSFGVAASRNFIVNPRW